MSITPSIALIPSGFKTSKVYSVLPENGDVDFNFSRGSSAYRTNEQGLLELVSSNIPRLDWYKSTCPSLIMESQATNLIPFSSDFTNSSWQKAGNTTVSANSVVSPEGLLNASRISGLSGLGGNGLSHTINSSPNGKKYTMSAYVKGSGTIRFQLSNGVNQSGTSIVTLSNEWELKNFTFTFNSTVTNSFNYNIDDAGSTATEYDIWGADLKEGDISSHIPTNGAAATRLSESASKGGILQYINSEKGVMFADIIPKSIIGTPVDIRINGNNNGITFFQSTTGLVCQVFKSGSFVSNFSFGSAQVDQRSKIAVLFDGTKISLFKDGIIIVNQQNIASKLSGLNEVLFSDNRNYLLNDFRIYDQTLSVNEIKKLTTL